ncbi:hypothetical protein M0811_14740 [Anaeramoeba ignava]|uniref:Uncharacterized protein n=1 Tax=Anaeramoeba ignava TaxID=1746090 RepID=A0A9Q0RHH7_ANAIG|nr:hypothetical protein M0811_14740 [Anaeramoeba ignava]
MQSQVITKTLAISFNQAIPSFQLLNVFGFPESVDNEKPSDLNTYSFVCDSHIINILHYVCEYHDVIN